MSVLWRFYNSINTSFLFSLIRLSLRVWSIDKLIFSFLYILIFILISNCLANSLLFLHTCICFPINSDACTVTRMSALLLRFFYKANLFGIFYYCMMWAFLIVSLGSFVYVTFKPKQTITEELLGDMDDFEEEIY